MKIKGFDENLCCRGFQFEVGHEYKIEHECRPVSLCSNTVFHYCDNLQQVHDHYPVSDEHNRFCEIEVLGEEVTDGKKCGSDHIRIVREITGEELECLKGKINGNSGLFNTGDRNTGNGNTGDRNTGNWNTGDRNTGDGNTGNWNTGDGNTGNWNTGNWNTGDRNTGDRNTGDWNTGDGNTGDGNSGLFNTGDRNTGNWNTGDRNTGDGNTGDRNTGDWNTGDGNTGDWNTGNGNTGCFMTTDPQIMLFNNSSNWTYRTWLNSKARCLLNQIPKSVVEWICEEDMTATEKAIHPTYKTTGGYLKVLDESECGQLWWDGLSEEERDIIFSIPNFDPDIFEQCTGIKGGCNESI